MYPICRKMEDTTEHDLQFGTELEESEQYRLHNNTEREWEEKYIYLQQTEKRERKKRINKEVEQTEAINTANTEEE